MSLNEPTQCVKLYPHSLHLAVWTSVEVPHQSWHSSAHWDYNRPW